MRHHTGPQDKESKRDSFILKSLEIANDKAFRCTATHSLEISAQFGMQNIQLKCHSTDSTNECHGCELGNLLPRCTRIFKTEYHICIHSSFHFSIKKLTNLYFDFEHRASSSATRSKNVGSQTQYICLGKQTILIFEPCKFRPKISLYRRANKIRL